MKSLIILLSRIEDYNKTIVEIQVIAEQPDS